MRSAEAFEFCAWASACCSSGRSSSQHDDGSCGFCWWDRRCCKEAWGCFLLLCQGSGLEQWHFLASPRQVSALGSFESHWQDDRNGGSRRSQASEGGSRSTSQGHREHQRAKWCDFARWLGCRECSHWPHRRFGPKSKGHGRLRFSESHHGPRSASLHEVLGEWTRCREGLPRIPGIQRCCWKEPGVRRQCSCSCAFWGQDWRSCKTKDSWNSRMLLKRTRCPPPVLLQLCLLGTRLV